MSVDAHYILGTKLKNGKLERLAYMHPANSACITAPEFVGDLDWWIAHDKDLLRQKGYGQIEVHRLT